MNGSRMRVAVRGGGDLGSGTAIRLWRCGFDVIVLETDRPMSVRRTVSFSEAVYDGRAAVEEARAILAESAEHAMQVLHAGHIPLLVDPAALSLSALRPHAVVDAIMAKRNCGTTRSMAGSVVCLGPGFSAGQDCHAVVETNRGPHLGRVIWSGTAEPNSGVPGPVGGVTTERVVRAPVNGTLATVKSIGDVVTKGELIANVDGRPVRSEMHGIIRGMLRDGFEVRPGMKIGDIDPRLDPLLCRLVSDKSLAIAGGVVEAICLASSRHD